MDPSQTRQYLTLAERATIRFEERRSVFIGEAVPVASEAAALEALEAIRSRELTATHHCYAYVLGGPHATVYQRFSDAGEPKKTAGKPILDAILGRELTDVLVVVTRYFGGVLLGTGGLVHAYSRAACEALDAANRQWMQEQQVWQCTLPYALAEHFRYLLEQQGAPILSCQYDTAVHLTFSAPVDQTEPWVAKLQALSAGQAELTPIRKEFVPQAYVKS